MISRRGALGLALGALAAPIVPPVAAAETELLPIWAVGVEDYPNWRMIAAKTLERAIQIFKEEEGGGLCEGCDGLRCAELNVDGDCEHSGVCGNAIHPNCVTPVDTEGDIGATKVDMKNAGWTHNCDRCHYDTPQDWEIVGDEAVCADCMTIEDWEIVDPQHATELREEAEVEFWEEFAASLQGFMA